MIDVDLVSRMRGGHLIHHYLLASYCYYQMDESPLTDPAFDLLCKRLLELFDTFEHPHKYLITKDDLTAGTCLLKPDQYPSIVLHGIGAYLHRVRDGSLVVSLNESLPH